MTAAPGADWQPGKLVWVERKSTDAEAPLYDVIFELDSDPDLLRQTTISEGNFDPSARRHDAILVREHDDATQILRATASVEV
jgi:hypothetical protein